MSRMSNNASTAAFASLTEIPAIDRVVLIDRFEVIAQLLGLSEKDADKVMLLPHLLDRMAQTVDMTIWDFCDKATEYRGKKLRQLIRESLDKLAKEESVHDFLDKLRSQ